VASSADAINAVPLQHAVLCPNCEVISDSRNGQCVVCGSPSLINLARVLGSTLNGEDVETTAA